MQLPRPSPWMGCWGVLGKISALWPCSGEAGGHTTAHHTLAVTVGMYPQGPDAQGRQIAPPPRLGLGNQWGQRGGPGKPSLWGQLPVTSLQPWLPAWGLWEGGIGHLVSGAKGNSWPQLWLKHYVIVLGFFENTFMWLRIQKAWNSPTTFSQPPSSSQRQPMFSVSCAPTQR